MLRVTSKYEVHTTKYYREHTLGMIYILSVLLCRAGISATRMTEVATGLTEVATRMMEIATGMNEE